MYLLNVIDFKLGRMQDVIGNGFSVAVERKRRVAEMRAVRRLIARVKADRYFDKLSKPHRARWGPLRMRDVERTPVGVRVETYFPKAKTTSERARARREYHRLSQRADEQLQQDIDELFRLMAQNIQRWWD